MFSFVQHNAVEPMQVDAPPEDNDNTEEEPYVVENPTLVRNPHLKFSVRVSNNVNNYEKSGNSWKLTQPTKFMKYP